MRKKHSPAFKFKVAFEALSGKSIVEICQKYDIAPSLVHKWKEHLKSNGLKVFGDVKIAKPLDWEREQAKLYQRIGELSTELEVTRRRAWKAHEKLTKTKFALHKIYTTIFLINETTPRIHSRKKTNDTPNDMVKSLDPHRIFYFFIVQQRPCTNCNKRAI